jgi:hypothetical protein
LIKIPKEPNTGDMLLYPRLLLVFWVDTHAKKAAVLVIKEGTLAPNIGQNALTGAGGGCAKETQHNVTTRDCINVEIGIVSRTGLKQWGRFIQC